MGLLLPLISTFGIISLAELGDKTQFTVINLSSCRKPKSVFIGAMLAFALVDGVSASIGGTVAALIPAQWIGIGAGSAFLIFGIYSLLSKSEEARVENRSFTVRARALHNRNLSSSSRCRCDRRSSLDFSGTETSSY